MRPKSSAPPPPPISRTLLRAREAYGTTPPSIRRRAPSGVALDDDDIIESAPATLRDPVPVLAVKLEQLAQARTTWEAAGMCAAALVRTLAARAVLVHLYDPARDELRIIGAHGPGAEDLLGGVATASDCVFATAVVTNKKPMLLDLDGLSTRLLPSRHHDLKARELLALAPVVVGERCVAVIEAVDVAAPWRTAALRTLAFAAERLATVTP
jgi:hypothetical protein